MTEAHHLVEKWENLPIRKDAPYVRGGLGKTNLTHPQIGAQEVVNEGLQLLVVGNGNTMSNGRWKNNQDKSEIRITGKSWSPTDLEHRAHPLRRPLISNGMLRGGPFHTTITQLFKLRRKADATTI